MKKFKENKIIYILNLVAIGISLISFFMVLLNLIGMVNRPIVMHFDDINGITQMGAFNDIIFITITGIIVTIINFFIALEIRKKDVFLAKIISIASILFAVLLFIAFTAILTMN